VRLAPLLALALLLAGCGGSSSSQGTTVPTATTTATTATGTRDPNGCLPGAPETGERSAPQPTKKLDRTKTYDVVVRTNCGTFTIRIDPVQAPNAAASFVALAGRGYFDHVAFHRIIPGFVLQGGDPTGSGTGGPGYSTHDTPAADSAYVHGVVAMAKTAAEPAGTAGSQFFVVTGDDAGLTPDYAIVGKVVSGLAVVDRIGKLGAHTGQPTATVEITGTAVKITPK
jgi:peptidyl-prolyl cis-trans isomerase B (cyclophilin B)